MRQATIIFLCIAIIWSYYRTEISANGEYCTETKCNESRSNTLFCRNKKKTSLDSLLPENDTFLSSIERLVIDNNAITLSAKDDIKILNNNLTSLRFLDLRGNKIEKFPSDKLNIHEKLEEIDLDGNLIKEIPVDFLRKMPNLVVMKLSSNKISKIPVDLLENNTKLNALVLSNNSIAKINPKVFKVGNKLQALLVDGNKLEDLDWDVLERIKGLKAMNVRDNAKLTRLNPKIFYEHKTLRFLFTSGYADCCNIKRMEKRKVVKPKWYCSYKHKNKNLKETCAVQIRSGGNDDTFMGQVEVNMEGREWQKLKSVEWTMQDANVVCKETGHEKALEFITAENYPRRKFLRETIFPEDDKSGYQWKKTCNGSEYSIFRCRMRSNPTDAAAGVGVRCKTPGEEMTKACERKNGDEINCEKKELHNLPWQDKNDTKFRTINLKGNKIRWIQDTSLKFFKNLENLDLSGNGLSWLYDGVFQIENLIVLNLKHNNLKYIIKELNGQVQLKQAYWFDGLKKLESLDLSENGLTSFPGKIFEPLKNLKNMSIRDNRFFSFPDSFFQNLKTVQLLDISTNPGLLIQNWPKLLEDLGNLQHLITSRFTDCCFVEAIRVGATCDAPEDNIASCERMIKFPELRFLMWCLVVLTIGGNIFALLMRLVKDDHNRVQNMLICSLSFSDMLMGVYLAGIIHQEMKTRGQYYKHDINWRTGSLCKVFGIISVISSEVSVLTLVFIAYDRFLHIVHALEFRKIGYRTAVFLLAVTWLGCSAIAIVPATVDSYFYDEVRREGFYGTNSICMPLQLPGEDTIAWEYCLSVFGVLNFIGAIYLIIAYCQMFYSSYTSAKNSKNSARLGIHTTMAKRFAAVVFTDVCCWVPIAMLLLLSLARAINDSGNVLYMWFSICVIPINSAINPILYTLSTPLFWQKVKETIKKMLFCVSKDRRGMANIDDKPELIGKRYRDKKA